ncbi:MAG: 2-C-methyl-D-erythritol 4-phosphate cytidylyltransferase [Lachnospiraceae bacterium]|nr:2-C-methyl-D-erythritol 4-phosphate cytidylyltransferase [Lachnospiraceae bacterium]
MIFGAVLAGGIGTRMHMADMPKQFLSLGDKPIIVHTVEKFLTCTDFDQIYIGVHPDWMGYMDDLLEKYTAYARDRIQIIAGGTDRNSTILNVVRAIEEGFGESDEHIIVTHDAVRPFVTLRMLEESIQAAREFGAADTVMPAVDTIVESVDGQVISDIPPRSRMYQGQTPQSFRVSLLKSLYLSLSEEEKGILTDACKICVVRNYPVHLVRGAETNIKITTPGDYKIAQAMVGAITGD